MQRLDKKNIFGLIICVLLIIGISFRFYDDYQKIKLEDESKFERLATADSKRFQAEYVSLNSKNDYLDLTIKENNPVIYKTDKEIVDFLNNSTGIVYFGYNTCFDCRNIIEPLIKAVDDNNLDNLYYVDIKDIKSNFEVQNKKLVSTKMGSESYYQILSILDNYLRDYKITVNNKIYDTQEKLLVSPTVVAIKNGQIVAFHEGASETQDVLLNIFNDMINKIND